MRKPILFAVMAFLVAACQADIDRKVVDVHAGGDGLFYATIEEPGLDAKVYADQDLRVLWNKNDRISVFSKNDYNGEYVFQGEDGDNSGTFGPVQEGTGNPLENIYAVYPFASGTSMNAEGVIALTLPAIQHYSLNSFGRGDNTMVSVTDNHFLHFKNACGYLSFKFYGENVWVRSVTLRGNDNEKLAGAATVTMTPGSNPDVKMADDALEEITLSCETPVALSSNPEAYVEFWFVLPPTAFTGGFTVTVTDAVGGTFIKATQSEIHIERNHMSRMAAVQVVPSHTAGDNEGIKHEIW